MNCIFTFEPKLNESYLYYARTLLNLICNNTACGDGLGLPIELEKATLTIPPDIGTALLIRRVGLDFMMSSRIQY